MNIFLDFDDTVFNTRSFRDDLKKVFVLCGVSEEDFHKSYQEVKEKNAQNDIIMTYDFDRHLQYLEERYDINPQCLVDHVDELVSRSREYIFSDVLDFLLWAKAQEANVFLISYGTSSFQEKKVIHSRIETLFSQSVVGDENKGEVVSRLLEKLPQESSFFVDDRVLYNREVKKKNPQVKTILLKRPEARYNDERDDMCDFEARDLEEVKRIIPNNITELRPQKK